MYENAVFFYAHSQSIFLKMGELSNSLLLPLWAEQKVLLTKIGRRANQHSHAHIPWDGNPIASIGDVTPAKAVGLLPDLGIESRIHARQPR